MADINIGYTWASGTVFTASKMNDSVNLATIAAGALSADATGRAKMADGYLSADATGRAKMADGFVDGTKLQNGCVLQTVQDSDATGIFTTSTFPFDDTVPTVSQGLEVLSASITPISTSNKILARVSANVGSSGANNVALALFRGSTCIQAQYITPQTADFMHAITFEILDSPPSTSAQTYSVRLAGSAGTSYVNRNHSVGLRLGGAAKATLTLQEIKG